MSKYTGIVLHGNRRGTALGYPTINIALDEVFSGVFAGKVRVEGNSHMAAIFADPSRKILEAHLLDFSGDLYDKEAVVTVEHGVRDARAFANDAELVRAIEADVRAVRAYFNK